MFWCGDKNEMGRGAVMLVSKINITCIHYVMSKQREEQNRKGSDSSNQRPRQGGLEGLRNRAN